MPILTDEQENKKSAQKELNRSANFPTPCNTKHLMPNYLTPAMRGDFFYNMCRGVFLIVTHENLKKNGVLETFRLRYVVV